MGVPRPAKGAKLEVSIAESLTKVGNVVSFGEHGEEQTAIEYHDLEDDAVRRIGNALADGGTIEVTVNYDTEGAAQTALREAARESLPRDFAFTYGALDPDDELEDEVIAEFSAVVQSWKTQPVERGTILTANVTLAVDGLIEVGSGA